MSQISSSNEQRSPTVIRPTPVLLAGGGAGSVSLMEMLPALGISAGLHLCIIAAFVFVILGHPGNVGAGDQETVVAMGDDAPTPLDTKDHDADYDFDPFTGKKPGLPFDSNDSPVLGPTTITGDTNPEKEVGTPDGRLKIAIQQLGPPAGFPSITEPEMTGAASGTQTSTFSPVLRNVPGGLAGRNSATRAHLLEQGGGSPDSEAAVGLGLYWLARHQAREGFWSLDNFQEHADFDGASGSHQKCNCGGSGTHDTIAATGLALLCFLGAGLTPDDARHHSHDYAKLIERGLRWLSENQRSDGRFADLRSRQENQQYVLYEHAIATICMCEAAGLYPKEWVRRSAQRAVNFLVESQDPKSGGWRYGGKPEGDTSVTGWCIMALQSARISGLSVPGSAFDKTRRYLDACEVETEDGLFYGYVGKRLTDPNQTLAAVGLLSRIYLGWPHDNPKLHKGVNWLTKNALPDAKLPLNMYYHYYATQVMHHMGGEAWKTWNPKMRDLLIARQDRGETPSRPHQLGSWAPDGDQWCKFGGRVMMTSLCVLTLEVYYRHLPLYRSETNEK